MHIVPYYLTYSRTNVIIVMLCVHAYGAMLYNVRCHVILTWMYPNVYCFGCLTHELCCSVDMTCSL